MGIFLLIMAVSMGIMAFAIKYAIENNVENIIAYVAGGFIPVVLVGCVILILYSAE